MSRVFKLTVFCCCIAGLTSAAFGHPTEPRMFWVGPDGDPTNYPSDTTIVWAKAGDVVHTELYYQGPDGVIFQSNAVQAFFDTTLLPSSGCVQSGNVTAICASAAIDAGHPDFAGFGSQTVSVPPAQCPSTKAGFVLLNLSPPFEEDIPGNPDGAYFGGIDWQVSGDACGDFVSYYVGTPNLETIIIDHLNQAVLTAIFDELQFNIFPMNDLCADAIVAAVGTAAAHGVTPLDNQCGCQHGPTPSCAAGPGPDVFFSVTANCKGELFITAGGTSDWALYADCGMAAEVACNSATGIPVNDGDAFILQVIDALSVKDFVDIWCEADCTIGPPAGDALTVSECGPPANPNDNVCELWFCDAVLGCVSVPEPNPVACDDGLFCTTGDQCDGANVCVGTGAYDCDDGSLCTLDSCCEDAGDPIPETPFTCTNGDECSNVNINDIPCTTVGDCPAAASDCIGGFCVCVENPALCLNVETQPGKNCLAGVGVGDEVIVTVDMAFSTAPICAAQFFLQYDASALDFNSITPGGGIFNTVLLEDVDEEAGTIDYIVGENPGAICYGTNGPQTIATISFTALAQCKNEGICFRPHNPPTILGAADGDGICPLGHLRPDGSCGLEDNPIADPCCTGSVSVDITAPEMNCPDFKTFGNADCGTVTRTVYWDALWAVDKCDGALPVACTIDHNGGADVAHLLVKNGGPFPPGITTIDCGETCDACNNCAGCIFSVGNSGLNGIHLEVELSPTMDAGPLTRCIEFGVSDCGPIANPGDPYLVETVVTLGFPWNIPGHGVAQAKVPPGNWMCIEAWDPLHTLNATCGMTCEVLPQKGSVWFASFKGSKDLSDTCHWLVNGNLNGDVHIDVLDYVTYLACVANDPTPDPDTDCDTLAPHCDINGDGLVSLLDFSFIMVNLFNDAKAGCEAVCTPSATPQDVSRGVEEISVRALIASGVDARVARSADVNNDGTVNVTDMTLFVNGADKVGSMKGRR